MKNIYLSLLIILTGLLAASYSYAQTSYTADFETYGTTPYFFRFGNKGELGEYTYKPRWMYSHTVIENPYRDENNPSGYVLEYTSMEARNYGLKFLLEQPVPIDELESVSVRIYQPANVIGREVETAYSNTPASKHNLCIKLLSAFNTINDFRQDDGILLYKDIKEHTTENEWKEYTFEFNKEEYSSQLSKFSNGVLGIAVLPTYDADVTLKEENRYICYIDDLTVRKSSSNSITATEKNEVNISYVNGTLYLENVVNGEGELEIYDMQGKSLVRKPLLVNSSLASIPVDLSSGLYIAGVTVKEKVYRQKFFVE